MNREEAIKFLMEWERGIEKELKIDPAFGNSPVPQYDFKNLIWILTLILKQEASRDQT